MALDVDTTDPTNVNSLDRPKAQEEIQKLIDTKNGLQALVYMAAQPILRCNQPQDAKECQVVEEEFLIRIRDDLNRFPQWMLMHATKQQWRQVKKLEMELALELLKQKPTRCIGINFSREQLRDMQSEIEEQLANKNVMVEITEYYEQDKKNKLEESEDGTPEKLPEDYPVIALLPGSDLKNLDDADFVVISRLHERGVSLSVDNFHEDTCRQWGGKPDYTVNNAFVRKVAPFVKQIKLDIKYMVKIFDTLPKVTPLEKGGHKESKYARGFPRLQNDAESDKEKKMTQCYDELKKFMQDVESVKPKMQWVVELSVEKDIAAKCPVVDPYTQPNVWMQGGRTNDFARRLPSLLGI